MKRRGAKAKFTRQGKAFTYLVDQCRPTSEVKEAFSELKNAYTELQAKHDSFTESIEDDESFDKEEK